MNSFESEVNKLVFSFGLCTMILGSLAPAFMNDKFPNYPKVPAVGTIGFNILLLKL